MQEISWTPSERASRATFDREPTAHEQPARSLIAMARELAERLASEESGGEGSPRSLNLARGVALTLVDLLEAP